MTPLFDLDKIKFALDSATFERAVKIYETGGINCFKEDIFGFSASVHGSQNNFYEVYISAKDFNQGNCDCYLGEHYILCKHMVVVAIYAVMRGKKLSQEDKELIDIPRCSGKLGELSKEKLAETKKAITSAIKYIKPYNGPSRIWFAYQDSLLEGCARLSKLVSDLVVSEQTAKLLIDMLLRLDKKLCNSGVDDSDGTVGNFMENVVLILKEYVKLDSKCVKAFEKLCHQETCFGWEESLVKMFDES